MCFCTPSRRTPLCANCNTFMFQRIMELTDERDKYKALCDQLGNALETASFSATH